MTRIPIACLAALACLIAAPGCHADNSTARIRKVLASKVEFDKHALAGRKAAFFCVHCHGEAGFSAHAHIPSLAGKEAGYLLDQFERFADGRRQSAFMSGLARVLKPDDRFDMAIYYSSLPIRTGEAASRVLARK